MEKTCSLRSVEIPTFPWNDENCGGGVGNEKDKALPPPHPAFLWALSWSSLTEICAMKSVAKVALMPRVRSSKVEYEKGEMQTQECLPSGMSLWPRRCKMMLIFSLGGLVQEGQVRAKQGV